MNLFFPVETINRELDWRLMMAVQMAGHGRRVFVGQHDFLDRLFDGTQGGLYVGKTMFKSLFPNVDMARRDRISAAGFRFVHLDAEGAFFFDGEDEWHQALDRRLDPDELPAEAVICTWGEFQAAHYKDRQRTPHKIHVTGHPRFDLYKEPYRGYWSDDTDRIKREHGRFVLVNTNLSLANNVFGIEDTFSGRFGTATTTEAGRLRSTHLFAHQRKVHAALVEAMAELATQYSDIKVIVRPHPAEDFAAYSSIFQSFPNIDVIHQGPVSPWILAAEAVIHDGCTTAVEAFLAGIPVLSFRPFEGGPQVTIPNLVGVTCKNQKALLQEFGNVMASKYKPRAIRSKDAHALFANFRQESFKTFANVLEEQIAATTGPQTFDPSAVKKAVWGKRLHMAPRAIVRPLFPARVRKYNALKQSFGGFNAIDIDAKIDSCQRILGKRVSYQCLSDDLILFESR